MWKPCLKGGSSCSPSRKVHFPGCPGEGALASHMSRSSSLFSVRIHWGCLMRASLVYFLFGRVVTAFQTKRWHRELHRRRNGGNRHPFLSSFYSRNFTLKDKNSLVWRCLPTSTWDYLQAPFPKLLHGKVPKRWMLSLYKIRPQAVCFSKFQG